MAGVTVGLSGGTHLKGAKHAIEHSEYLPTLNRMLECCQQGLADLGLPPAHNAYVEACSAPSPKSAQAWSHAAVYLAGRDSDWFFLANNTERTSWPVFKGHYEKYCARVLRGESLTVPEPEAIEQKPSEPIASQEQLAQVARVARTNRSLKFRSQGQPPLAKTSGFSARLRSHEQGSQSVYIGL